MPIRKSLAKRFERYVKLDLNASARRNSRFLALVGLAFICFIALGAAAGSKKEGLLGRAVRDEVEPRLERMENETIGVSYGLDLATRVIANNTSLALEVVGLGIGLGVYPAFILALNGLVIGYLPFYVAARLRDFSTL
ncbi:MAG: stage II sporulation protein M, partial [Hadesarchaea archaeon]|nr:stage II sporulation protein M [Hadesarchaea archaeon]